MRNKRARQLRKAAAAIAIHNNSETKQTAIRNVPTGKTKEDGTREMIAVPSYTFGYLKGSFKSIYKKLKKNWVRRTGISAEIV
jgi:hypothetical protein